MAHKDPKNYYRNDEALNSQVLTLDDYEYALRVEGIETWIDRLLPAGELQVGNDTFLRLIDPETKAVFLIRRVE